MKGFVCMETPTQRYIQVTERINRRSADSPKHVMYEIYVTKDSALCAETAVCYHGNLRGLYVCVRSPFGRLYKC